MVRNWNLDTVPSHRLDRHVKTVGFWYDRHSIKCSLIATDLEKNRNLYFATVIEVFYS